jgi:hypothetical protein
MKRTTLPLVLLIAISVIAAEGVIFAPSGAQVAPAAIEGRAYGSPLARGFYSRASTAEADPQTKPGAPAAVETIQISDSQGGSSRYPAVAENRDGDRLIIFRGPDDTYWYSYSRIAGVWSAPASIPGQPSLKKFLMADIEADSTGRFHCVWEQPGAAAMYASFMGGTWTTPARLQTASPHEWGVSIAVRSNDEVVVTDTESVTTPNLTKDVFISLKGKSDTQFQTSVNLTDDVESSSQAWSAVDANNHIWIVYKEEWDPDPPEILGISLLHLDETNTLIEKLAVSEPAGWSFWPQVAVNSEGKVMTAWAYAQSGDYWSRLYDPAAGTESSPVPLGIGLSTNPWCTFFSRLAAHGPDFYAAAIDRSRILFLLKYDEAASQWTRIAQISDRSVETFDLYAGNDEILVVWGGFDDPSEIFVTTVDVMPIVSPKPILTIQSGPGGTTVPGPGSYKYVRGARVSVRASADAGYRLSHWSGDASGDTIYITVTMDRDKTVMANFTSAPRPALDVILTTTVDESRAWKINTLSWRRNPENSRIALREYGIYRKRAGEPDSDFAKIATVPPDTFTYEDGGLPLSQKFVYRITTIPMDSSGEESGTSEPVSEKNVFPPLSVACRTVVNNSLFRKEKINIISWQRSPLNEAITIAQYDIYRKNSDQEDSAYRLIASVAGGAVEFQDRMLSFGERYDYAIKTVDTGGSESGISNRGRE